MQQASDGIIITDEDGNLSTVTLIHPKEQTKNNESIEDYIARVDKIIFSVKGMDEEGVSENQRKYYI